MTTTLPPMPAATLAPAISTIQPQAISTKLFQPWLNAWTDPIANLHAFSACLALADVSGDGEYRLLVADSDKRLKVFRNTAMISEHALVDPPTAIATFYPDLNKPQLPNIAIASGSSVFIYRNLRPYYKFALPAIELDVTEVSIWQSLKEGGEPTQAMQALSDAKENGVPLSVRSMQALELTDTATQHAFLQTQCQLPYSQLTVATCLCALPKNNSTGDKSVGHLLVGTEAGDILLLEANGTALNKKFPLQSTPQFMVCDGTLDIEFRLFVACRNAQIYCIKKGKLLGQIIECESAIVSMAVIEKILYVACMDYTVTAYNFKFKKLFTLNLKSSICSLDVLTLKKIKNQKLLLIALNNGTVAVYHQKNKLTELNVNERITAMKYGQYGREEASLVIVTHTGKLLIKILQRSAQFDDSEANGLVQAYIHEQDIPLNIPKKTALYVEQTQREREHAIDLHRIFQRDLCKLRLETAKSYVKVIQEGMGNLSSVGGVTLKLDASVLGLGPQFRLRIGVKNIGNKLITDVTALVIADTNKFALSVSSFKLSMLVPGVEYVSLVDVKNIDADGAADAIKVFVCNPKSAIPAISAQINMPVSELDEE